MNSASSTQHIPVLSQEILSVLDPQPGDVVFDGTLGNGGHAKVILERMQGTGTYIGMDRDPSALETAKQTLASFTNIQFVHGNFRDATVSGVTKVLLDLGWSATQLSAGRGFSFQQSDAPLDMRYDPGETIPTAADLLNTRQEQELCSFFREYGEEPRAERLARAVVQARKRKPFVTVHDLTAVVEYVSKRHGKLHPATKVFQALRIAVNDELGAVTEGLPKLIELLEAGGRIAVITFHSLEDRIAKRSFKTASANGNLTILSKHVLKPTREEQKTNPRSRSAKLRIAQKT